MNALNIRLDAETIAFILEHGGAKVLITDTEFSPTIGRALALLDDKPLVIDIADPAGPGGGERLGALDYEAFIAAGDPDFAELTPERRVGRDRAQLHLGHHRQPEGRRLLTIAAPI